MPVPQSSCSFTKRTMHASDIDRHSIRVGQMQEDDVATFSRHYLTRDVLAIGESESAGLPGRRGSKGTHTGPSTSLVGSRISEWVVHLQLREKGSRSRKKARIESRWQRAERVPVVQRSTPAKRGSTTRLGSCCGGVVSSPRADRSLARCLSNYRFSSIQLNSQPVIRETDAYLECSLGLADGRFETGSARPEHLPTS